MDYLISNVFSIPLREKTLTKWYAQTLMYGNPDYPIDHFTFKNQSPDGDSGCENQCAFRDKYFTVEVDVYTRLSR